jgi:hypothetical protein
MERSIELRQMQVLPGIAHDYWVLKDGDKVIGEIHGWPYYIGTNTPLEKTDLLKYFGESDLKFDKYDRQHYYRDYHPLLFRASTKAQSERFIEKYATQIVLPTDKIEAAWNAMRDFEKMFNDVAEKNPSRIRYELLDTNSNSMAYSLGVAAGFKEYLDNLNFGPETAGFKMWLHPGWRKNLLPYFSDFPVDMKNEKQEPGPNFRNEMRREGQTKQTGYRLPGQSATYRDAATDVAAMSPAAARRAIAAAKADDGFGKRYVSNDRDTVDYMHALHRAAYPEAGSDSPAMNEQGERGRGAPRRGPAGGSAAVSSQAGSRNELAPWMSEATAAARKALTDLTSDSGFVDRYLKGGRQELDRFQGLMRAAYPEPDAVDAGGAGTGGAGPALEPWSPSVSSDAGDGVAPWLRDAFTREATRAPGAEPNATIAPWMDYRKPDWRRDSGE